MDFIQNENLFILQKINRKIVQRAFHNSIVNAKYKFPKNSLKKQANSQVSDSSSQQSNFSQTYNLHQQNMMDYNYDQLSRKIAPISSLLKIKKSQKESKGDSAVVKTLLTSRKSGQRQRNLKRQFLSLTPRKQQSSNSKQCESIKRKLGNKQSNRKKRGLISEHKITKYEQKISQSFINSVNKFKNQCFGSNYDSIQQKQSKQAIFYNKKLTVSQQTFTKNNKTTFCDKLTAAQTPLMGRNSNMSKSKPRRGLSRVKLQQTVTITPFLYA